MNYSFKASTCAILNNLHLYYPSINSLFRFVTKPNVSFKAHFSEFELTGCCWLLSGTTTPNFLCWFRSKSGSIVNDVESKGYSVTWSGGGVVTGIRGDGGQCWTGRPSTATDVLGKFFSDTQSSVEWNFLRRWNSSDKFLPPLNLFLLCPDLTAPLPVLNLNSVFFRVVINKHFKTLLVGCLSEIKPKLLSVCYNL